MDVSLGRSQTTKGVWLSHNTESKLLVIDLEGTDSKERGDIGKTFEQSTALFALTLADVLIVNMWKSVTILYRILADTPHLTTACLLPLWKSI